MSGDGQGIDVWLGSSGARGVTGVLSTIDLLKRDIEIKLLLGCSLRRLTKFRHSSSGWKCGSCCRSGADERRLAHALKPGLRCFLKYPALEAYPSFS